MKLRCRKTGKKATLTPTIYANSVMFIVDDAQPNMITYLVPPGQVDRALKELVREETKLDRILDGTED